VARRTALHHEFVASHFDFIALDRSVIGKS